MKSPIRCSRRTTFASVIASLAFVASCISPVTTPEAAIAAAKGGWVGVYDKTQDPVFSPKETEKFEPYTATLDGGVWTVKGTVPRGFHGKVLETTVQAADGGASVTVLVID